MEAWLTDEIAEIITSLCRNLLNLYGDVRRNENARAVK
jgi:hypothetical protein